MRRRRIGAWERFAASGFPSEAEEIWRYSGIDGFDPDTFAPSPAPDAAAADAAVSVARQAAAPFADRCALVVSWHGSVVAVDAPGGGPDGVTIDRVTGPAQAGPDVAGSADGETRVGALAKARDAFGELHDAYLADVVSLTVAPKAAVPSPIVVVHVVDPSAGVGVQGPAAFPHTCVSVGTSAEATVFELVVSPQGTARPADDASRAGAAAPALVVPVTELDVADDAHLTYVNLQVLAPSCEQIALQASRVGRDSSLRTFTAAVGGGYARLRTDSDLVGTGGRTSLLAAYLGTGQQVVDFRTLQDHHAARTDSELLFQGAVADTARSVYSGLIRIRPGARGANAFQTNRNLVLSEGAHADSVPNLDILENDVRCSHASTVGPIDEDQRYYLESRGIEPGVAERLIVLGFFADLAARAPAPGVAAWVEQAVATRIGGRAASGRGVGRG